MVVGLLEEGEAVVAGEVGRNGIIPLYGKRQKKILVFWLKIKYSTTPGTYYFDGYCY